MSSTHIHIISLSAIQVDPDRQRKEFRREPLESLAESIRSRGLLQPIVVSSIPPSFDTTDQPLGFELRAGERRLRAIGTLSKPYLFNNDLIPPGFIPCTLFEDLDPYARKEIELHENILREPLTWQERNAAISELDELRRRENPSQTTIETARELAEVTGGSISASNAEIVRAKIISKHMSDPRVASARNPREAYSIICRGEEAKLRTKLAELSGLRSPNSLIEGDCIEALSALPSDSFNMILTDPPYGINADSFGDAGASHHYKDDATSAYEIHKAILSEGFRLCKQQASLFMFCDIAKFASLREMAKAYGWYAWRTPLIWSKSGTMGHDPLPSQGFRRSYELILFCIKNSQTHNTLLNDVIECPRQANSAHPAAKPVELLSRIMLSRLRPGDTVLDPCCGTGSIFPAANLGKFVATGIEIDPKFVELSRSRLASME